MNKENTSIVISISMDRDLYNTLQTLQTAQKFANTSEYIRHLIRSEYSRKETEKLPIINQ